MNRTIKILLVTFISIIVVLLISISALLWVVFTPEKLTPMVQKQLKNYISCPVETGDVSLTFFSTFPEFAIKINGINLTNPMVGANSDTLLSSGVLSATIDIKEFLKNDKLILTDIVFENLKAHLFKDATGKTNFNIFISDSTTQDTSAFENPFELIHIDEVKLVNANITYTDLKSALHASVKDLNANMWLNMEKSDVDIRLKAETPAVFMQSDSTIFLNNIALKTNLPLTFNLSDMFLTLSDSEFFLDGLKANISGTVNLKNDIETDLNFETSDYPLNKLLTLVPAQYLTSLEGMKTNGVIHSNGTVKGTYNDSTMPLIDVNATLAKGTLDYNALPAKLREMNGNVDVHLDLNNEVASHITVHEFGALTGNSKLEGKGLIDFIMMDDMLFDLDMKLRLQLEELKAFLPKDMNLSLAGTASGTAKAKFMLSDAMNARLEKMNVSGVFDASQLRIDYDSLSMFADKAKLKLQIPNKSKQQVSFMNADLWCSQLSVQQGKSTKTKLHNVNLLAQTSNLMETDKTMKMDLIFDFDLLKANVDDITAALQKSNGNAHIQMNLNDTTSWPTVDCDFDISKLNFVMDSTSAEIVAPKGNVTLKSDKWNVANMLIDVLYSSTNTQASMGEQQLNAENMNVNANIVFKPKEENVLLQWTPTGHIAMHNATLKASGVDADIRMPVLEMKFTPESYLIESGKLLVDNSDFELSGKLWNVDKYLKNEGLLMGNFKFRSQLTDVYRLMELTSDMGTQDSTLTAEQQYSKDSASNASNGPYMVPKGMDLTLDAEIEKVQLGFDSAVNLLGKVYVKDGLLVLEDLRFNTSSARMQLTAMYRTPRRNHLFVGLDYHMTNTEISQLLKTIPDIDSIMPMLRSFGGKGEFHIAAETYMDSAYNLKPSTIRGVSSIKGENLVLMDGETFAEIAKKLRFSKQAKNKVDSLSAEFTIFRNEVDVYPFQIVMDKYKAVIGGRHNLDMSFDYHISLTDSPLPIQIGVDVKGTMDDMKISLAKSKYARLYRPVERREIDNRQLEIRKMIRDALTSRVKE